MYNNYNNYHYNPYPTPPPFHTPPPSQPPTLPSSKLTLFIDIPNNHPDLIDPLSTLTDTLTELRRRLRTRNFRTGTPGGPPAANYGRVAVHLSSLAVSAEEAYLEAVEGLEGLVARYEGGNAKANGKGKRRKGRDGEMCVGEDRGISVDWVSGGYRL